MDIRILTQEDWEIWKQLRLDALQNAPENFGSSYEEECNFSEVDFQNQLQQSTVFGVIIHKKLVSCAGFYVLNKHKMKHRGLIWGMYTQPAHRGQGIASSVLRAIIDHAKLHVMQLHITCVTTNFAAMALYQKHGFTLYGTEPRALKIGDTFFDEHLMVLQLGKTP
jgi:RimJ/RimL family protein N-acetyltransferase